MGMLFQVLEIIFEMKRKMNNEKVTRREIDFSNLQNMIYFYFFFGTFLFSNFIIFLFLIHFI
jgi:hypothetical protein